MLTYDKRYLLSPSSCSKLTHPVLKAFVTSDTTSTKFSALEHEKDTKTPSTKDNFIFLFSLYVNDEKGFCRSSEPQLTQYLITLILFFY
jgi:hypothetical protein